MRDAAPTASTRSAVPTDENPRGPLAIDNQLDTYWSTQNYYDGKLNKAGTGLYLDANPGTAGAGPARRRAHPRVHRHHLRRATQRRRSRWPELGLDRVSAATTVTATAAEHPAHQRDASLPLLPVWITNLGSNHSVQLDELTLYR